MRHDVLEAVLGVAVHLPRVRARRVTTVRPGSKAMVGALVPAVDRPQPADLLALYLEGTPLPLTSELFLGAGGGRREPRLVRLSTPVVGSPLFLRHGDVVVVHMPLEDGRAATTTEPVVSGKRLARACAQIAGTELLEAEAGRLGTILGALQAIEDLEAAGPALAAQQGTALVRLDPKVDPGIATAIQLFDRARVGDDQAAAELEVMAGDPDAGAVVREAHPMWERLLKVHGPWWRRIIGWRWR